MRIPRDLAVAVVTAVDVAGAEEASKEKAAGLSPHVVALRLCLSDG